METKTIEQCTTIDEDEENIGDLLDRDFPEIELDYDNPEVQKVLAGEKSSVSMVEQFHITQQAIKNNFRGGILPYHVASLGREKAIEWCQKAWGVTPNWELYEAKVKSGELEAI